MHGQVDIFLLSYMVAAALPTFLAFNINLKDPEVYAGEQKDFFGYKVLQFKSGTDKGFIVSAPLKRNGTGGICKPDLSRCFSPPEFPLTNGTVPVKHFGLSIAEDPTSSSFTVCSPSIAHECDENTYLNSVCYQMTDQLQAVSSFKPLFQKCTEKVVDLVFLFDGSASMNEKEFNKNKDFIVDIMKSLTSTSIKFAAVQFSTTYRKVFDFNDYAAGTALDKLRKEEHLKSLTNTHRALKYVLEDFFENPASGASTDATQVVVLITDGDPSDADSYNIIKRYDDKNIIRFVIGVKEAELDKFRAIASEPKDKNAFKIENYDGLTGILENFQKKVFKLEGSKVARAGDLINEMSQAGFSAVFHQDRLILGSVGTKGWRGSIQELHGQTTTHIEDSQMKMDSYMGYSVSVGEKNKVSLFFTGAPRFLHKGQVVLFKHNGGKWTAAQRINGEKFGSYFGAELCSVDVNSDGDTDFLLVGAPQFYQPSEKKEGQIYVYTLTDEKQLIKEQDVTAPSMGRFGTTISSLADLNGDGLRDVAVGAPMEDENRGVMYIYLGDRHRGMRSTFSQRIMGQKINSELRFFGQAIDGDIDLGKDGLPDIVVGSQGKAVVLSSRPVFNIMARLSFQPKEISTDKFDCLGNKDEILSMITLQACFKKVETTKSKAAEINSRLNISYALDVDPTRQTSRGFFSPRDKKARNYTHTYELGDENTCFNYSIYMTKCVIDTLSPIVVKLHFSQDNSENASAILNVDSKRQAVVEIPFEKQCRGNDTCIAELEVDFNFMTPTLLVTENSYFNVTIKLSNQGDDSYNTSLTMYYPPGLSFSMMTLTKSTRPTLHTCHDLDAIDKTICGVSRPVYRSQSAATFHSTFHIRTDYEWNDTISVTITGNSDNTNSTGNNSMTKSIPVQFEVKMAVTVKEDSVTYLNFTTDDAEPKKLVTMYKIDNLGFKAFPINVSLFFPTKLEHNFEMTNSRVFVKQNKTKCASVDGMNNQYCSSDKRCTIIKCDSFILESESAVEFELSGDVQFRDLKQHAANIDFLKRYTGEVAEVRFKSVLSVDYDKQRYVLNPLKQLEKPDQSGLWKEKDPTVKETEVRIELIIPSSQLQIILTGAGLGLLLLIIITIIMFKLGCFKRKTLEDYQAEDAALQAAYSFPTNQAVNKSEYEAKSDQTPEDKKMLDDVEKNDSPLLAEIDTKEECPSYEECLP
ncbi:integrin alpha-D [Cheilinus undulatus]|uniref:integrin alpha-D n=1 Tax=Cheilinus undulatus TaxID=241271 RepID=UPI001BD5A43C|nr:integrin alpha-D [Cheilinus undulatus]